MIALATAATVIASQATISGAYSMTQQAIQLGYLPRMTLYHTLAWTIAQIYVPSVNWIQLLVVAASFTGFGYLSLFAFVHVLSVMRTISYIPLALFFDLHSSRSFLPLFIDPL